MRIEELQRGCKLISHVCEVVAIEGVTALMLGLDDLVETLVNPLMMAVVKIFGHNIAQLVFGRQDEMVETFLFDGPDKPFRVGIEIGTSCR